MLFDRVAFGVYTCDRAPKLPGYLCQGSSRNEISQAINQFKRGSQPVTSLVGLPTVYRPHFLDEGDNGGPLHEGLQEQCAFFYAVYNQGSWALRATGIGEWRLEYLYELFYEVASSRWR